MLTRLGTLASPSGTELLTRQLSLLDPMLWLLHQVGLDRSPALHLQLIWHHLQQLKRFLLQQRLLRQLEPKAH